MAWHRGLFRQYRSKAEKLTASTCCPLYPRVWTAPSWQELFSRLQHWSVRPCVRPLDAVHTTAGHNALRGSGPDRKPAFDNAWGQLGCPDRRIDRLCITCCSSSQPSHHAGCPARSRLCRKRDGFLIVLALGHDRPCHPGDLVGKRNGSDLDRSALHDTRKPQSLGAALACISDDSHGPSDQQPSQPITIIASLGLKVIGLPICSILTAVRMTDYAHFKANSHAALLPAAVFSSRTRVEVRIRLQRFRSFPRLLDAGVCGKLVKFPCLLGVPAHAICLQ